MILFDPNSLELSKSAVRNRTERACPTRRRFRTPEEFSAVISPHITKLIQTASSILMSEDLAWDAVLETLQRIWVQGSLPEEPQTVLRHLVVKSCLHQRRCNLRREFHESAFADGVEHCCDEDPLASLASAEQVSAIREAVNGIAEKYRIVLQRVDLDGESYQVIAEELDVPIGTIRSPVESWARPAAPAARL